MTPHEWILSNDTGVSSKTIWAVMMGLDYFDHDVPSDPSDFGRCYRLLQHFPEWRSRLPEVAKSYPYWEPFIRIWHWMEHLWEDSSEGDWSPELYPLMKSKYDEIMTLKGYTKISEGYYRKGAA